MCTNGKSLRAPPVVVFAAESLRADLARLLKVPAVELVIRPDSFFGFVGGPMYDVLAVPYPDVSESTYEATPFIRCEIDHASGAPLPCKVLTVKALIKAAGGMLM